MLLKKMFGKSFSSTLGSAMILSASLLIASQSRAAELGVLMASHGDVDSADLELEDYVKTAFLKNVGIPFPFWFRPYVNDLAYKISINTVRSQYDQIGPTGYRASAEKQVKAIERALKDLGIDAKVYFGANFAKPLIEDTLAVMQKDGIKKIVVINKGAQFSWASSGENIGDVRAYLKQHPEWDVEAIGVHHYNDDQGFREAWASAIERDARELFPSVPAEDLCVLVGTHGLPTVMTKAGDPAIGMMKESVAWLRTRLPEFKIYHGFLNDDFIPGAEWSTPKSSDVAEQIRSEGCPNVLMDSRLSFTSHHRATLFDLNIDAREIIEKPDLGPDRQPHPNWVKPKVVLAPQFDGDAGYARAMARLTESVVAGQGYVEQIKRLGGPLLPRPDYPVKSNYINK